MKPIFISAGHGASDPGAVAYGRSEAAVVLDFRDMVAHYLPEALRDGVKGENLPLSQAVKMVPKGGVAVEFHLNAAESPAATGVETLSSLDNAILGGKLCKAVSARLGIRNRGAKGERSGQHSRLAFVQAGGIILELFFLSNPNDLAAYDAKKWLVAKDVAEILREAAQ